MSASLVDPSQGWGGIPSHPMTELITPAGSSSMKLQITDATTSETM